MMPRYRRRPRLLQARKADQETHIVKLGLSEADWDFVTRYAMVAYPRTRNGLLHIGASVSDLVRVGIDALFERAYTEHDSDSDLLRTELRTMRDAPPPTQRKRKIDLGISRYRALKPHRRASKLILKDRLRKMAGKAKARRPKKGMALPSSDAGPGDGEGTES